MTQPPLTSSPRCLLALFFTSALMACNSAPQAESGSQPPAAQATAASGEETGAPAASSAPAPPGITSFGVPDCDEYVKKYLECVEGKVSPEQREQLMAAFEVNRTKWRALATMREGAVALGLACRAARQKSKEDLTVEYGCEF